MDVRVVNQRDEVVQDGTDVVLVAARDRRADGDRGG
jgi:hypothetical protein